MVDLVHSVPAFVVWRTVEGFAAAPGRRARGD